MTLDHKYKLETLLEQVGSEEIPGDSSHRYALRRALLRSRSFEVNRLTAKWIKVFSITTSAVAGSAVMAVFVVSIYVSISSIEGAPVVAGPVKVAEASRILPEVEMMTFDEVVPVEKVRDFMNQPLEFALSR